MGLIKIGDKYALETSLNTDFCDLINSIDEKILSIEGLDTKHLDIKKMLDKYSETDISEYSIEGNSNATGQRNYSSRQGEVYKPIDKLMSYQMLWEQLQEDFGKDIANDRIKEAIQGSCLIHDLTNGGIGIDYPYCTTISSKKIMEFGRPYNDLHSQKPEHLDSFVGQVIEYVIDNSNVYAGAQAIPDFFINLAFYSKNKNSTDKEVEQSLQRLVHIVNNPYRPSCQSPFLNLSLMTESGIFEVFGSYKYPNGELAIDYIDEILRVQKIFAEYFGKGIEDGNGVRKPASFPVVTINVVRDKVKEDYEYIKSLLKCFNKFMNTNIFVGSADKFASCCRLINDMSKANAINSFGAGAVGEATVGSLRVISLDLWDIALETKNRFKEDLQKNYFKVLNEKMESSLDILYSQRKLVEKRFNEGFHTFYNLGWIKLEDYFSTWGAGGLYEAVKTVFEEELGLDYTEEQLNFAKKIPQFMEKFAEKKSDKYMKLNVEFLTPLESGASRLGQRIDFKYGFKDSFVSNQLLPLTISSTIARRLEIEEEIGGSTSAGGIYHCNVQGEIPFETNMKLINKIITDYPSVEHFALNKTSAYCEDGHLTLKNIDECDICGKPIVEKITRTIGYFKPVKNFSKPRKKEFSQRTWHNMPKQHKFIDGEKNEN